MAAGRPGGGSAGVERIAPGAWGLVEDWDDVVAGAAAPSVFLTRDWAMAWWESFGSGLEPLVLRVAGPEGRTLGIAPLYVERLRGGLVRRLGLVADRVVGSEYLGLIARRGAEAEVARSAAGWLAARGIRWDVADLGGLRATDPAADELERTLLRNVAHRRVERQPCAAIALPDDFEAYLAGLAPKFRRRYRQQANRLNREFEVRFHMTASEEELPRQLEEMFRLHQSRWIASNLPGAFADPRMRRFYLDVSRRLLRAGRLRFWHLAVEGDILASQYGFVYDGVFHSLQEAFDADFTPRGVTGLGVVLRGHVLRSAIEEGIGTYDFLGGAEEHKLRWGASIDEVRRVRASRMGARGGLAWQATLGAESARTRARRALPDSVLETYRGARGRLYRLRARSR